MKMEHRRELIALAHRTEELAAKLVADRKEADQESGDKARIRGVLSHLIDASTSLQAAIGKAAK